MIYCLMKNVMKGFDISRSMLPDNAKIINHKETLWNNMKSNPCYICDCVTRFIHYLACAIICIKRKVNETISSLNKKLNFMARYDALTSLFKPSCVHGRFTVPWIRERERTVCNGSCSIWIIFKGSMMKLWTQRRRWCL